MNEKLTFDDLIANSNTEGRRTSRMGGLGGRLAVNQETISELNSRRTMTTKGGKRTILTEEMEDIEESNSDWLEEN